MTDSEKHEWCKQKTGFCACIVPAALYDAFEKSGADMSWFVKSHPIQKTK